MLENGRQQINLLWTGGFDSTFRLTQLMPYPVDVQPYYVIHKRKSEPNELHAIESISKLIRRSEGITFNLKDIKILNAPDMIHYPDIKIAFDYLSNSVELGSQYTWLSAISKMYNNLELSLEYSENSKIRFLINKYGKLKTIKEGYFEYFIIDKEQSSDILNEIFAGFRFPIPLYTMKKIDCRDEYIKNGHGDIMDLTWFCHQPIDGSPCGFCKPCIALVDEGMSYRLGHAGNHRNKYKWIYSNINKILTRTKSSKT